jgi:hypothetical protein
MQKEGTTIVHGHVPVQAPNVECDLVYSGEMESCWDDIICTCGRERAVHIKYECQTHGGISVKCLMCQARCYCDACRDGPCHCSVGLQQSTVTSGEAKATDSSTVDKTLLPKRKRKKR